MIFGRKQEKEVERQIAEYCQLIAQTVAEYREMIAEYIDWDSHFKKRSKQVHRLETQCDALRRGITKAMYEGAFLPAYREDYIVLLERLDLVANKAEDAGDTLFLMEPDIPGEVRQTVNRIADLTVEAFAPIPDAVQQLLNGRTDFQELEALVGAKEQEVDKLQFDIIRKAFQEFGLDKAEALCLKLLTDRICEVSDKIENVMDQMAIIAIKRRL